MNSSISKAQLLYLRRQRARRAAVLAARILLLAGFLSLWGVLCRQGDHRLLHLQQPLEDRPLLCRYGPGRQHLPPYVGDAPGDSHKLPPGHRRQHAGGGHPLALSAPLGGAGPLHGCPQQPAQIRPGPSPHRLAGGPAQEPSSWPACPVAVFGSILTLYNRLLRRGPGEAEAHPHPCGAQGSRL